MTNNGKDRSQGSKSLLGRSDLISLIAMIVATVSLLISVRQCNLGEKALLQHIEPTIKAFLLRDNQNSVFVLKNESPIRILSVLVHHESYVYSCSRCRYHIYAPGSGSILDPPGKNWVFMKSIGPFETAERPICMIPSGDSINPPDWIIVRLFDIEYYRETDMKKFEKRAIFFSDTVDVYTYAEAIHLPKFRRPVELLDDFILKTDVKGDPLIEYYQDGIIP